MTVAQLGAGDAAFWVAPAPRSLGVGDSSRPTIGPLGSGALEPGVFDGQAVEVALEAGGRAEQKHARLAQVGVGVRREHTSTRRAVGTGD